MLCNHLCNIVASSFFSLPSFLAWSQANSRSDVGVCWFRGWRSQRFGDSFGSKVGL